MQAEAIRLAVQKEDAERAIRALDDQLERISLDAAALRTAERVDAGASCAAVTTPPRTSPCGMGELAAKRDGVLDILRRLGREGEVRSSQAAASGADRGRA